MLLINQVYLQLTELFYFLFALLVQLFLMLSEPIYQVLFESKDDIEIFNKKAIYLYLREITGLNTKQVVNSLNKFREHYRDFKSDWENGKI